MIKYVEKSWLLSFVTLAVFVVVDSAGDRIHIRTHHISYVENRGINCGIIGIMNCLLPTRKENYVNHADEEDKIFEDRAQITSFMESM